MGRGWEGGFGWKLDGCGWERGEICGFVDGAGGVFYITIYHSCNLVYSTGDVKGIIFARGRGIVGRKGARSAKEDAKDSDGDWAQEMRGWEGTASGAIF